MPEQVLRSRRSHPNAGERRGGPQADGTTADRIINTAIALFAAKGFQATGIREIAEKAQLTSSALYYYMGTKEDLLFRIMEETLSRGSCALERACDELQRPEEQIVALIRIHVICSGRYQLQWTVVDTELRSLFGERRALIGSMRDKIDECLSRVLQDGVEQGVFDIADVRLARLGILEMCNGVTRWFSPRGSASLEKIADEFAQMALALVGANRDGERIRLSDLSVPACRYHEDLVTEIFEKQNSADRDAAEMTFRPTYRI